MNRGKLLYTNCMIISRGKEVLKNRAKFKKLNLSNESQSSNHIERFVI